MGLEKSISYNVDGVDTGINLSYWKISATFIYWSDKKAIIEMEGYVDKNNRDNGKEHVDKKVYVFDEDNFDYTVSGNVVSHSYNKIKVLDEWSGYTDVYEEGQP